MRIDNTPAGKGSIMASVNLNDRTLELLRNRPRTLSYAKLAEAMKDIHPAVTLSWIQQYAHGRYTFPPIDRVQALYEFLTGKPLIKD